ncbi:MAG: hypothetical protein L6R40_007093 [Gallowayella cf. fulva]|nr:MAG: hypothetical protein L6R40_007093 [Xanthomendoza cf. fulva]
MELFSAYLPEDLPWLEISIAILCVILANILAIFTIPRILSQGEEAPIDYYVPLPEQCKPGWTGRILEEPSIKVSPLEMLFAIPGSSAIQCYNPATGQLLGQVNPATPDGIDRAVTRAAEAQKEWAKTTFKQRRKVLRTMLKFILDKQEDIATVACMDSGKTKVDAMLGEILVTVEKLKWTIHHGEKALRPERRPTNFLMMYKHNEVRWEPLGVLAACVSWNYPFHNALSPIISTLFTGSALLVKSSEQTAFSAPYFTSIAKKALSACGHSPHLVQSLVCWPQTANHLTSHPGISHITFIGSRPVAHTVCASAAKVLTPVCVELGGKDPAIILDSISDSDLQHKVLPILMKGTFISSGQNCIGIERIIACPHSYTRLLPLLETAIRALRLGPLEIIYRRGRLDVADPTSSPFPSSSTAAAGEAGNDDVKQGDDAVDDGFEDGTNSIDDGHDASTDGLEDRLDLCDKQMRTNLPPERMTPIKIRGKRGQKARLRAQQEEGARLAATEELDMASSTTALETVTLLSRLEALPTEIIESIFLYSRNLNLPRASIALGQSLSSTGFKHLVLRAFLTDPYLKGVDSTESSETGNLQSALLRCRWVDEAMFMHALHDVRISKLAAFFQHPSPYTMSKVAGIAPHNALLGPGCPVSDTSTKTITEFVESLKIESKPSHVMNWQWISHSNEKFSLHMLPDYPGKLYLESFNSPDHAVCPDWHGLICDFQVAPECEIPTKVLSGPWTKSKLGLLHALKDSRASLDWERSNNGETAAMSFQNAILDENMPVLEVFLGKPSLDLSTSHSVKEIQWWPNYPFVPLTQKHLRLAIFKGGCNPEVVSMLLYYGHTNSLLLDDDVVDWATVRKEQGDPRAEWLIQTWGWTVRM